MQSKANYTLEESENYKDLLITKVKTDCNYWKNDKINLNDEIINTNEYQNKLRETWDYINNNYDPFLKRVIFLKYDYQFNEIKTNKIVGNLMCCSEEWIRKNIEKIKKDEKLKRILEV
jgi:hypothetical protein